MKQRDVTALPLIRRKTFMRRFTELGQAYRRRIEEAERERDKARGDLQRFIDSLAPRIATQNTMDSICILVEVDRRLLVAGSHREILEHVRDSVMRRLMNLERDYRGDMRQTPGQRMLGV